MILYDLLSRFVLVVGGFVFVGLGLIVGPTRLIKLPVAATDRLRDASPYAGLLALVLGANSLVRDYGQQLSWIIDWNITGIIYSIEGSLVAQIQAVASPRLTALFSAVYIYGYVFLLVFPLLAYLALDDGRPLRELLLAYTFNYAVGVVLYVLFIAYGPRNLLPDLVDSLMYARWPESQLLTSEVNSNTNVFPSLHASLAATVSLLAYRTRRTYPAWLGVSVPVAGLVIVATMYLGIHWAVDVVGGIVLAVVSVGLAIRLTDDEGRSEALEQAGARLANGLRHLTGTLSRRQ